MKEENEEDGDPAALEPAPAVKKGRAKKAKSAATVEVEDAEVPVEDEPAPAKKGRAKKGTAKAVNGDADGLPAAKAKPQKRKGKKVAAEEE